MFKIISQSGEKTVLFHCFAGRDRTALVSLIILYLAEVNEEDIINDYLKTFENIRNLDSYKNKVKSGKEKPLPLDIELKKELKKVIFYIKEKYGSFEKYLLDCGLDILEIKKIKGKIV